MISIIDNIYVRLEIFTLVALICYIYVLIIVIYQQKWYVLKVMSNSDYYYPVKCVIIEFTIELLFVVTKVTGLNDEYESVKRVHLFCAKNRILVFMFLSPFIELCTFFTFYVGTIGSIFL